MRVCVAGGATAIFEAERHNLVRATRCSHLVTIGAGHGGMCSGQSEPGFTVLRDGKEGAVKIAHGMAILASVQIRSGSELAVMSVLVTIRAKREFHFVNRVFAGWKMAFGAFDRNVLAFQRIGGCVVLFYPEQ